jgi:subtilisin
MRKEKGAQIDLVKKMNEATYLILPPQGLSASQGESDPNVQDFLESLLHTPKRQILRSGRLDKPLPLRVVDSVKSDGAKLVKLDPAKIPDLHLAFPGIRIIPEVFFFKAVVPRKTLPPRVLKQAIGKKITVRVVGEEDKGISGAQVIAFTDFENGQGAQGKTSSNGIATLNLPEAATIERLYIYPQNAYWPFLKKNVKIIGSTLEVALTLILPDYPDAIDYFYKPATRSALDGKIKVAVIDTGVGPHKEINLVGGECTVENEKADDYGDYDGHGTHVAGIISSFVRTSSDEPGIEIMSFRVFPSSGGGASNYSIVKAIDRAVASGCVLINMSLGGGDADDATKDAIADAQSNGVICFVATGNDGRGDVSFPASYSLSLAVGAMGRKGTFPKDAEANDSIKAPYGKDKNNFFASFSNIGPEVDMIGPGVGIVSCAPGDQYAVMSGTSMSCPAAVGMAARLLLIEGVIINQTADANRANSMIKFLGTKLKALGFGATYEGKGMLMS